MKSGADASPGYTSQADEQLLSGPLLTNLAGDVLSRGVPFRLQAGGSSMFPFIRDGDVVSIRPLKETALTPGDVIAFRLPDKAGLAIHRVIKVANGSCVLKGDNYPRGQLDGPVTRDHLLGIVALVDRQGRQVRLGLGPERLMIALLSRLSLLQPIMRALSAIYRPLKKIRSMIVLPTRSL